MFVEDLTKQIKPKIDTLDISFAMIIISLYFSEVWKRIERYV